MKKLIISLLIAVLVLSVCACGSVGQTPKEQGAMENTEEDKKDRILELLGAYVDVEAYEKTNGTIYENELTYRIDTITIDDSALSLGMTYEDVVAAGFEPTDTSFPEKELSSAVASVGSFENQDGKQIQVGFYVPDRTESGVSVKEGRVYSVCINCYRNDLEIPNFDVDGINADTSLPTVLDKLGEPYYITDVNIEDKLAVQFQYYRKVPSTYVTVTADLETEEILSVTVEGYTE